MLDTIDLARVRWILMSLTELEAATMAMLEAIGQARDDLRSVIEGQ